MNKLLIIVSLSLMACSNNASRVETIKEDRHDETMSKPTIALQLNNGAMWKTDEATRNNVVEMVKLLNGASNVEEKNRAQLAKQLQARIDTLVQQCKMKGPNHDALHQWLQRVLYNLKELKGEGTDYQRSYAALKKEVENFYAFFE